MNIHDVVSCRCAACGHKHRLRTCHSCLRHSSTPHTIISNSLLHARSCWPSRPDKQACIPNTGLKIVKGHGAPSSAGERTWRARHPPLRADGANQTRIKQQVRRQRHAAAARLEPPPASSHTHTPARCQTAQDRYSCQTRHSAALP